MTWLTLTYSILYHHIHRLVPCVQSITFYHSSFVPKCILAPYLYHLYCRPRGQGCIMLSTQFRLRTNIVPNSTQFRLLLTVNCLGNKVVCCAHPSERRNGCRPTFSCPHLLKFQHIPFPYIDPGNEVVCLRPPIGTSLRSPPDILVPTPTQLSTSRFRATTLGTGLSGRARPSVRRHFFRRRNRWRAARASPVTTATNRLTLVTTTARYRLSVCRCQSPSSRRHPRPQHSRLSARPSPAPH